MKLIPRFKSISFITFCFNFAAPKHFYKVDKYIENFEFVTDDISAPKDTATEKAFIGDYFESPRRNIHKNNDKEFEAIKREYLKELEEQNKIDPIAEETNKANALRKSQGSHANGRLLSSICGADMTDTLGVVEGTANIESFPWLGVLIYPKGKVRLITTVILVTRNTVIGSALDIERLPKLDFRKNSKVVLGQTCKHPGIKVLDYNYHPDYGKQTYSSVVLIQLHLASVSQALWPICGPPKVLKVSKFYTITLPNDCRKSEVEIFSMDYVKSEVCKHYYRRTGLDLGSIWPRHGACGRARTEDECVWRNGAALVVKQRGRWHLMGIGVNGPGCAAPSRYVDYAAYSGWVADSVARIGRPALTRLADNHLILRRTIDKIQRYGPCDANEVQTELFCDRTNTTAGQRERGKARYNLTLIENYDYTCIALKANSRYNRPKISLRGICDSPHPICYSANRFALDFYIEIAFSKEVWFKICVYGKLIAMPDPKGALKYFNRKKPPVPIPWGISTPTDELFEETNEPEPPLGFGEPTPTDSPTGDEFSTVTPSISKDNDSSSVTPPEFTGGQPSTDLPIGDEFTTVTPSISKDNDSSSVTPPESTGGQPSTDLPTGDEFTTVTPSISKDNDSSSMTPITLTMPTESTPDLWSLTTIVPNDNESSYPTLPENTDEFWTLTPVVPKGNESSYPTLPENTDEFWTLTPVVPKGNESSYPTLPEHTGEFWTLTPIVPKDNGSSYTTQPEPTGDFWTLTPIVPKGNESSYPTLPEHTGEFWTLTPIVPKDSGSSYPTPPEPTDDYWTLTPIVPKDNRSSYPTPPEPTGDFWTLTPIVPKDNESSYPAPPEPTGDFWTLTPIVPKDNGSSYLTPPEPTGEFWALTPTVPKDSESYPTPPEPTGEFWSFTPVMHKGNEASYPTPPDLTGELWSLTPILPKDDEFSSVTQVKPIMPVISKDYETFSSTPDEPIDEFWSLTPATPTDDESYFPLPIELTGESVSLTSSVPKDDEYPSVLPVELTAPITPKDDNSLTVIPIELTGELWSLTPVLRKDDEFSPVIPMEPTTPDGSLSVASIEPTGEFWSLTQTEPREDESSYGAPIDALGEYWSLTPAGPRDEEESLYGAPIDSTIEILGFSPILPNGNKSSSIIPNEHATNSWNWTDMLTITEQTAPITYKTDLTSFTEDSLQPWWTETAIASTDSLLVTGKERLAPDMIGVTVNADDQYQPWWTEVAYSEETGVEDMFTKEQETLWPAERKVPITDKNTKVNSLWTITPVNKPPGGFMPSNGEVIMVTPKDTSQEEKVTPINEPEGTEKFDMFWSVTPVTLETDVMYREDANGFSPRVAQHSEMLKQLENRWTTEESVSIASLSELLTSETKHSKTSSPKFVGLALNTKRKHKYKIEYTSTEAIKPQSEKNPVSKENDPKEASQLEELEKKFEEIIYVTPLSSSAEMHDSIPHAQKKLHTKTDMTSTETIHSLKEESSPIKNDVKEEILAITPVTMPLELTIVTTKIVSSQEEDIEVEILRMSKLKPRFEEKRLVKPQRLSDSYRQPIYLRNLVTRRQKMSQKSGLSMRQMLIRWNRPRRPGGFYVGSHHMDLSSIRY